MSQTPLENVVAPLAQADRGLPDRPEALLHHGRAGPRSCAAPVTDGMEPPALIALSPATGAQQLKWRSSQADDLRSSGPIGLVGHATLGVLTGTSGVLRRGRSWYQISAKIHAAHECWIRFRNRECRDASLAQPLLDFHHQSGIRWRELELGRARRFSGGVLDGPAGIHRRIIRWHAH